MLRLRAFPLLLIAFRFAAQSLSPEFEAASLKAVAPNDNARIAMSGGPGTADPSRISYTRVTFANLLARAYDVAEDQISGPSWMTSDRFTLIATLPSSTTKTQLQAMLQRLLTVRFHLAIHHETRDFRCYQLTIAGKGLNAKNLKRVPDAAEEERPEVDRTRQRPESSTLDENGCPLITKPGVQMVGRFGPKSCSSFQNTSMAEFAKTISVMIQMSEGTPASEIRLRERTGITGQFNFTLKVALIPYSLRNNVTETDTDPPLEIALEQQLGLKLAKIKEPLDAIVVDQADRTPAEN